MRNIEVYKRSSGMPFAVVHDSPPSTSSKGSGNGIARAGHPDASASDGKDLLECDPEDLHDSVSGYLVEVAISHEQEYCVATAIAKSGYADSRHSRSFHSLSSRSSSRNPTTIGSKTLSRNDHLNPALVDKLVELGISPSKRSTRRLHTFEAVERTR